MEKMTREANKLKRQVEQYYLIGNGSFLGYSRKKQKFVIKKWRKHNPYLKAGRRLGYQK